MQCFNKTIEAVIFDMDGTMFDTERLRFKMLKQASKALFGTEMSDQLLYDSLGVSAITGETLAKELYGDNFPYKEIRKMADELEMQYIMDNGVPVKEGLYNLLERLKKNQVLIALATSSRREIASRYMIRAKVYRYFDILVCGDDVENGKPDPEIFTKAIMELSCPADRCLIVEDSQNGMLAAIASGAHPVFIKDMKDIDPQIRKKAFLSYDSLRDFLKDVIPFTPALPIPSLYESFPLNTGYEIAGIHGFGAIGGGYLAQIFSYWDGYTRPQELIAATPNPILLQLINSFGKYRVKYESLAYFQSIETIKMIDINDEDAMLNMYLRCCIIGLSVPESVLPSQAGIIAKGLLNRYETKNEPLTILIVMNKINAGRFVKRYVKKELLLLTDESTANKILNHCYFSETIVNRMVSRIPETELIAKLKDDLYSLYHNVQLYSEDLQSIFTISEGFAQNSGHSKKSKKRQQEEAKTELQNVSISGNISGIARFTKDFTALNLTLFSSESDMPLYATKGSPLLERLRQVELIEDIKFMQQIKNKLSNGTHAIIAWYSSLLGYETIGQGMGDERVKRLAVSIMKQELRPVFLEQNPDMKTYINSFIANFIVRCRVSFKDKCSRVGRDPLRKLQKGERVLGAVEMASDHQLATDSLEFGIACGLLYSLYKASPKDKEAMMIRSLYGKSKSITDVLTYSGPYNNSRYKGLHKDSDHQLLERISLQFDKLKEKLNFSGEILPYTDDI